MFMKSVMESLPSASSNLAIQPASMRPGGRPHPNVLSDSTRPADVLSVAVPEGRRWPQRRPSSSKCVVAPLNRA